MNVVCDELKPKGYETIGTVSDGSEDARGDAGDGDSVDSDLLRLLDIIGVQYWAG